MPLRCRSRSRRICYGTFVMLRASLRYRKFLV